MYIHFITSTHSRAHVHHTHTRTMHNKIFDLMFYCILTISFRMCYAIKLNKKKEKKYWSVRKWSRKCTNISSPKRNETDEMDSHVVIDILSHSFLLAHHLVRTIRSFEFCMKQHDIIFRFTSIEFLLNGPPQ